jgi:hypothetical protein
MASYCGAPFFTPILNIATSLYTSATSFSRIHRQKSQATFAALRHPIRAGIHQISLALTAKKSKIKSLKPIEKWAFFMQITCQISKTFM